MEGKNRIIRIISRITPFLFIMPLLTFVVFMLYGSLAYVVVSFIRTIIASFVEIVSSRYFITAYITTLKIGLAVVLLSALLSYPLAIYGKYVNQKLGSVLSLIVFIPLMVNPLIRAFGWMIILGREGLINSLLMSLNLISRPLNILYTEQAVILGLLELFFPFMYLSIYSGLENVPQECLYAARSLGAGVFRVFVDVIFPLSITGFVTGASIIMVGCAAAFVTPSILGGLKVKTLSVLLREYVDIYLDWSSATVIAIVILATAVSVIGLVNLIKRLFMKW